MSSTHILKQIWKWTSLLASLILLVVCGGRDAQGKGGQWIEEVRESESPLTLSSAAGGRKMYWTDWRGIKRADLNGDNVQEIINVVLNSPDGIGIDVAGGKIYWTDSDTKKIQRANLDGTTIEDLITTGLSSPEGIILDVANGKMYWADDGTDKIQRANLDGTAVEDLVITELSRPTGIGLDIAGGKMYWADSVTQKIQRANLDGTAVEDLVTTDLSQPRGITIDATAGKMYWTDIGTHKIQRANLDGTAVEDLVTVVSGLPESIALDVANGKMYWADDGTDKIQRANLDGTAVENLVSGLISPQGIVLDIAAGKMYWTDRHADKIQRANLDGTAVETLVIADLALPEGIALDVTAGKMYWTDDGTNKIQRANLDGTAIEDLVTTNLSSPEGIALDVTAGKMYWADSVASKIQRANLNGSIVEDLVTTDLISPQDIALDVAAGKMYWADDGTSKIQRANLDGTAVEDLITTGLSAPYGITLDVAAGKMYWTDWVADKIQRANLDGTSVEDLITTELVLPYGITLDVAESKIYWVDSVTDMIHRANLDGTGVEDLVADLVNPRSIALDLAVCYALTLTHIGSGSDPVASPANSSGCESGQYMEGESISLTANPSSSWHVAGWNGTSNDTSTSTNNTVIMPASDHTVTVNYEQNTLNCYTLTRFHTGAGSDPTAIPTNSSGCAIGQYVAGESISLAASPDSGWQVTSWNGTDNDSSTSTSNSLTMPANDLTVTVNYQESSEGDAYEVDDICNQAQVIATDGTVQDHTFHDAGDADWVQFSATAGMTYVLQAISGGSDADLVLELYDDCGGNLSDSDDNAFGFDAHLIFNAPADGVYYVRTFNHDSDVYGSNVGYELSARTQLPGGVVLIVAGHDDNYTLQNNILYATNLAYRTFLRGGVPKNNIRYLSPIDDPDRTDADGDGISDVFATSASANVATAITTWAANLTDSQTPFYLYMIDHGGLDVFLTNGSSDSFTPNQLDIWLNNLEAASGTPVSVIYEACRSGSFIDGDSEISKPGRVVIASTGRVNDAYPNQDRGAYFSDAFFTGLGQNQDLYTSFQWGVAAVEATGLWQTPWLEDTGNGVPNEADDGLVAHGRGLAHFTFTGSRPPMIDQVLPPTNIENGEGQIRAQVRDDLGVARVWVEVYPPSFIPPDPTPDGIMPELNLPMITLSDSNDDGEYVGVFEDFTESGIYRLIVYAEDDEDNISQPVVLEIRTTWQIFLPVTMH